MFFPPGLEAEVRRRRERGRRDERHQCLIGLFAAIALSPSFLPFLSLLFIHRPSLFYLLSLSTLPAGFLAMCRVVAPISLFPLLPFAFLIYRCFLVHFYLGLGATRKREVGPKADEPCCKNGGPDLLLRAIARKVARSTPGLFALVANHSHLVAPPPACQSPASNHSVAEALPIDHRTSVPGRLQPAKGTWIAGLSREANQLINLHTYPIVFNAFMC